MKFKVSYVELPALDLDRAIRFYAGLLQVEVSSYDDGVRKVALLSDTQDGNVGMSLNQTANFDPGNRGALVYLTVDEDLEHLLPRVEALGGKILEPKTSMGEYGFYGIFEDSEGNRLAFYNGISPETA